MYLPLRDTPQTLRSGMRLLLLAALAAAQDPQDEPTGDYKELLDRVALLEERLRLTNIPEVTDDENDERSC